MAVPTNREEFTEYCLRKLGKPVISIDVTPEQVDDRVDEALKMFWDFHYDGSGKAYYRHQVTQEDVDNGYFTLPETYNGVVGIFSIGSSIASSSGMFSIQYQIALNDLYAFSGVDLVPYWVTMENLAFIEQVLVGMPPIRYNQNMNRLYVDINREKLAVGSFIVAEVYEVADPDLYPDVWKDRWFAKYATALIKKQWGSNISKFDGDLTGGLKLNGARIYAEAVEEVEELEAEAKAFAITAFDIG